MKHKLIVFDWNGTILSDTRQSLAAGNVCLEFYGAAPISLRRYRETFTFPILHFYKKNGLSVDDVLAKKDEANAVFQADYERRAAHARTRKGARALLRWIKGQGYSCIILSNYRTARIEAHLKRLQLEGYFSHVSAFGCEGATIVEVANKKERLAAFMAKRGYRPSDVVIVGDSTEEPEIARSLGLKSIGITDGYITRARLRAATPDYMVDGLLEIQPILEKEWR